MPRWTAGISTYTPAVDIYETADEVVLNAYLPGMSREDIHVEVLGDTIHISGESKPNLPEKDVTVHLAQGGFGQFDLRYTLPAEVKADQVKAVYRNGVLEIRLPKAESAKPQPVEVQIEG
jgi:HSP20 family protein